MLLSIVGEPERRCYKDVVSTLKKLYPEKEKRVNVNVLIPGAGLARLAWELISEGFSVQGNEFSMLMLLTSNFILNQCKRVSVHIFVEKQVENSVAIMHRN